MVNLDYLYNPKIAKPIVDKDYFVDKKLGFSVIENGMILPNKPIPKEHPSWGSKSSWLGLGGIVDNNGNYFMRSHLEYVLNGNYTPPPESIQHSTETVIYLGFFHRTWGHGITDCFRRLWFLNSEYFNEFKDCPLVFIPHGGYFSFNTKNFMRLLEIFGVDLNRLKPITEPTKFEKIILPDESYCCSHLSSYPSFFTDAYRETIAHIRDFALKNRTPTASKKIYYFHGRYKQIGEERLAEYFKSKGYEVVRPELLTTDEQLNFLINCESFASTFGSISHNSLFLREGTQTIFLTRAVNSFTGIQGILNQVNRIEANYLDSNLSIFAESTPKNNCFIISKQLKEFFGDKWNGYEEEDFKIFLQYVKNCLLEGLVVNPNLKQLYGKVLEDFMAQLKQHKDLIASYDMPPRWETFQLMTLIYQTHVGIKGWGDGWKSDNQISNPLEEPVNPKFYLQAIKMNAPHKVYYSVYFNEEEGWSEEVTNPEMAGTTGKAKPIYGMRVRLDEAGAKEFNILYRMHKFDGTWTPWVKNGEELYSKGVKLNAIQIKLEPVKSAEADIKKVDDIKPAEATNRFDYTQTALLKSDEIYLQGQGQRQNLTQIKLS